MRSEAGTGAPPVCLVGALLSYLAKSPGIESFPLEEVAGQDLAEEEEETSMRSQVPILVTGSLKFSEGPVTLCLGTLP